MRTEPYQELRNITRNETSEDMFGLPAWIYDNDEFLELEKEQIFARAWQIVCHVSDIPKPGDYRNFSLLGEDVFVMRGADEVIRGFYNVCRHRAARLLDGETGNCPGRIVCPYHSWAYESSGELVWVPFEDEYEGLERAAHGLATVECEIHLGFVFIRLESGGKSLEATLAPLTEELSLYHPEQLQPLNELNTNEVAVNWKNGTDNYVDALHVRLAHPGLNSLLNKTYTLEYLGEGVHRLYGRVEQITGKSADASRYNEVLPDVPHLPETHKRKWVYYMVWPNFAFNIYPDQVEFMQFLPVAPARTQIRFGTYALHDERETMAEAREINIRLNNQVGMEDTDLITRVQAGMASRSFVRGPLGKNEICLRAFAKRMRELLPVSRELHAPSPGTVAARNVELGGR